MSAKSPEVVDGMIDDSLLGILIILLVVMISTGYVYVQQLRQGDAPQRGNAPTNVPRTASTAASAPGRSAINTAGLNDRQLRFHFTLPMRNGVRTVTISGDALLQTSNPDSLTWTNDEVPTLLADLSHVADVYLLCTVKDTNDTKTMQRIREFVSTHPDLKGVKAHKILFCTTAIGKVAFVRQIEPQVHVEVDAAVVRDLEKHVPRIVHIPTSPEDAVAPSVPNVIHVDDSFAGYFALLGVKERL